MVAIDKEPCEVDLGEDKPPAEGDPSRGLRLRQALVSRPRGIHVLIAFICFSLGFAIASQVIAQRDDPFDSLSQQDLVVLLEELSDREEALRSERAKLAVQLSELEDEATKREAALDAAKKSRELAQINAALVPVYGPGVSMVVKDPTASLKATHFVMAIGELRNAGAEAASLNGIRLTMRSSFTSDASGVYLDGQRIHSPYVWNAVGEAATIATALEIPGGSASQMRAKGAEVEIVQMEEVIIERVAAPMEPRWARPVE